MEKQEPPLPGYTLRQLASRNGCDREETWVAYQGIIYDAGPSRHWKNGLHYEHWAGQDLTAELAQAPHAEEVFGRLKKVGRLLPNNDTPTPGKD